jgi:uncharacterized protein
MMSMDRQAERPLKIWALLGARHGDNNQVLALAESTGAPFETKTLSYNSLRHLQPPLLGATFRSLDARSRALVSADWPDLTISAGHRSVPVVQAIRRASKGRTRSVHVGYPRISPGRFDLVVATPEYPIADHANLLRIPFALTRAPIPERPDPDFERAYPTPRRLLILGGPTLYWKIDGTDVLTVLGALAAAAQEEGGSVLVVGSPRTPQALIARIQEWVDRACIPAAWISVGGMPPYRTLLAAADSIWVTADSVAMVSDVIATRKPLSLVPIRPTWFGRLGMDFVDRLRPGRRMRPRDLRFFWRGLREHGLVGTNFREIPDLTRIVGERIQELLSARSDFHQLSDERRQQTPARSDGSK